MPDSISATTDNVSLVSRKSRSLKRRKVEKPSVPDDIVNGFKAISLLDRLIAAKKMLSDATEENDALRK